MQSECVTPYIKELEQLELSSSTKSATADKFIIAKKKHKQCVEHSDHCDKIKTIR